MSMKYDRIVNPVPISKDINSFGNISSETKSSGGQAIQVATHYKLLKFPSR